jgi:phage tail-like protein
MAAVAKPKAIQPVNPIPGILIGLQSDILNVEMHSDASGGVSELHFPFHAPLCRTGITIQVSSSDTRYRLIRIRFDVDEIQLPKAWRRWFLPTRRATAQTGGDSVDAQDRVSDDGESLVLLIEPGERRELLLELSIPLREAIRARHVPFEVVAEDADIEGGVEARLPGSVRLVHGEARMLDMLPSIYREALGELVESEIMEGQPPFFERYLRGFEDCINPLRIALDGLDRLFGAFSTPAPFLLWLGAWVTMPQDERWPEMQRRRLIKEAVEIYRWRGTARGLKHHLEIYTGVVATIDDQPVDGMRLGGHAKLGSASTVLGHAQDHTFAVTLVLPDPDRFDVRVIREIIRWNKPAHTHYSLQLLKAESRP